MPRATGSCACVDCLFVSARINTCTHSRTNLSKCGHANMLSGVAHVLTHLHGRNFSHLYVSKSDSIGARTGESACFSSSKAPSGT